MSAGSKRIALAYSDDWMAVYVDGRKVHEDHSVDEERLLDLLGIPYTWIDAYQSSVVGDCNGFPDELDDFLLRYDDVKVKDYAP